MNRWWGSSVRIVAVLVATAGMPTPAAASGVATMDSDAGVAAASVAVVGTDAIQFRAQNSVQADTFDAALRLAYDHPEDMGYPWLDTASNVLSISAANTAGAAEAAIAVSTFATQGVVARVKSTAASVSSLDAVGDDVTHLVAKGVPNADLIWKTEPDQLNNRLVITMTSYDDALASALASRYGPQLIEIRVEARGSASVSTRDSDNPAFWGGAYITTSTNKACTTGFAWLVGSQSAMLTAAHCISTGGRVSYPSYANAGSVAANSEENWNDQNGTQYYTGQSSYRGDVALIRYGSYASAASIYSGAPHTSTNRPVSAKASRWSQNGDTACINGVVTGEWCGMVTATSVNAWYLVNGINVWARNIVQAEALGNTCPTHGDSGAPVYRKLSDGSVAAVGVLSGNAPLGVECVSYFTDIWNAYYGLPGDIKTQ